MLEPMKAWRAPDHWRIITTIDAHITGRHEFLIDPDDPLQKGFVLR